VFSVVLSVQTYAICITSNSLKNEDIAKFAYFCDCYAFLKTRGAEGQYIFMKRVQVSQKVGNLCFICLI